MGGRGGPHCWKHGAEEPQVEIMDERIDGQSPGPFLEKPESAGEWREPIDGG